MLCITSDFTRYDEHAVRQIPRNIELIRYRRFDEDLLLLELVNSQTTPQSTSKRTTDSLLDNSQKNLVKKTKDKDFIRQFEEAKAEIQALYDDLSTFIMTLGDDVTEEPLKLYNAFRKLKNFACVILYNDKIKIKLALNPDTVKLEQDFSRDVRQKGTWGTLIVWK